MARKSEEELLLEEAKKGNGDAYYNLGYIYLLGQGVKEDAKKAIEFFRKGTSYQNTKCMQALAMCYKNGDGVEVDLTKTVYWLKQGVQHQDTGCMYHLGLCYEHGWGVSQDLDQAIEWMKRAEKKEKDARIWLKQHGFKKSLFSGLFGG